MTIKSDVIADIKKRVSLGVTLYEIAKDQGVSESYARKCAMVDEVNYIGLRNRWISSVRESRKPYEQCNEKEAEPVYQGYKRRRAFIRFGPRMDR